MRDALFRIRQVRRPRPRPGYRKEKGVCPRSDGGSHRARRSAQSQTQRDRVHGRRRGPRCSEGKARQGRLCRRADAAQGHARQRRRLAHPFGLALRAGDAVAIRSDAGHALQSRWNSSRWAKPTFRNSGFCRRRSASSMDLPTIRGISSVRPADRPADRRRPSLPELFPSHMPPMAADRSASRRRRAALSD